MTIKTRPQKLKEYVLNVGDSDCSEIEQYLMIVKLFGDRNTTHSGLSGFPHFSTVINVFEQIWIVLLICGGLICGSEV